MQDPLVNVLARQRAHGPETVPGVVKFLDDVMTRRYRRQGELPELVPETGSLGDEAGGDRGEGVAGSVGHQHLAKGCQAIGTGDKSLI